MLLNRNFTTGFYTVKVVSYGKEYFKVFSKNKPFLLLSVWRKESIVGHESNKLI